MLRRFVLHARWPAVACSSFQCPFDTDIDAWLRSPNGRRLISGVFGLQRAWRGYVSWKAIVEGGDIGYWVNFGGMCGSIVGNIACVCRSMINHDMWLDRYCISGRQGCSWGLVRSRPLFLYATYSQSPSPHEVSQTTIVQL